MFLHDNIILILGAVVEVLVGSKNEVKVGAVRQAFEGVLPNNDWTVEGMEVNSGVSEQPLDEQETVIGARNRANALKEQAKADYYVGIEGGLIHSAGQWMECGWVVILDNKNNEGIAASAKMMIPEKVYEFLRTGEHTLNDVCEKYFEVKDAGKKMGYFGIMTNGVVDRERAYIDAVAFALSRFAHPEIFEE
jgi:inosine/xanthosine triphosphatase